MHVVEQLVSGPASRSARGASGSTRRHQRHTNAHPVSHPNKDPYAVPYAVPYPYADTHADTYTHPNTHARGVPQCLDYRTACGACAQGVW